MRDMRASQNLIECRTSKFEKKVLARARNHDKSGSSNACSTFKQNQHITKARSKKKKYVIPERAVNQNKICTKAHS